MARSSSVILNTSSTIGKAHNVNYGLTMAEKHRKGNPAGRF
jgi:hypothetical protein